MKLVICLKRVKMEAETIKTTAHMPLAQWRVKWFFDHSICHQFFIL